MTEAPPTTTGADEVRGSFVPTVEDQYRAQRALMRRSSRFVEVGFPVVFGVNCLVFFLSGGWAALSPGWIFPVMLAAWLFRPRWRRWQIRRHRERNPTLQGPHTITVSGEGVRVEGPSTDVRLAWHGVVRARETPEMFLLYFTRDCAYFLPKRAVRETDEPRLRALLAGHLGDRAQLRND